MGTLSYRELEGTTARRRGARGDLPSARQERRRPTVRKGPGRYAKQANVRPSRRGHCIHSSVRPIQRGSLPALQVPVPLRTDCPRRVAACAGSPSPDLVASCFRTSRRVLLPRCDNQAGDPSGGTAMERWLDRGGLVATLGEQPGDKGVRIPHVSGTEFVPAPR
jgi:hypothetical protein